MSSDERIIYNGNPGHRNEAIVFINASLRRYGDLGTYGDLRCGLESIISENNSVVEISDEGGSYGVAISPPYGQGGHDFFFSIDKTTGKMSEADIGEVMPLPSDDTDS